MRKFIVIYLPSHPPVPQVAHCDADDVVGAKRFFAESGLDGEIVCVSEITGANMVQNRLKPGEWVVWRDPDGGLSTQPAVVVDAQHADFAVLRGAGGSEIEAPYHEIDVPLTPIDLDGLAYNPARAIMPSQSNEERRMNDLTLTQFLHRAFAVLGRSPSDVVSEGDLEDVVIGMDVSFCPEEMHLGFGGGVAQGDLAEFFLDASLSPKWGFVLSGRTNTGGIEKALGFLSDTGALRVILTDDEEPEWQRVSLEFYDGPDSEAWLERQKYALVASEVRGVADYLDRLSNVMDSGVVDQMLTEARAASA